MLSRTPAGPLPVIGFVGASGSGKTTLIERLLPLLRARGIRTAVLKHAHKGFELDRPGKDSHRVRAAGAEQVLVASARSWALLGAQGGEDAEPRLDRLLARFNQAEIDLVLCEGFAHEAYPKIEVYRPSHGQPPKCWPADPDVIAVASDIPVDTSPPVARLDLNRPQEVLAWLLPRWAGLAAR